MNPQKIAAVDIETPGLRPYGGTIWMVSMTKEGSTKVWHDCNGIKQCPNEVRNVLTDPEYTVIIHSSEFDVPYMQLVWGIRVLAKIADTRLMEIIIQATQLPRITTKSMSAEQKKLHKKHSSSLKFTLPRYGFPSPNKTVRENFIGRAKGIPFTKAEIDYAGDDTKHLPGLWEKQQAKIKQMLHSEVAGLENAFAKKVATMKTLGIGFSKKIWLKIAADNLKAYKKLIATFPKQVDNWGSPKQVKEYFATIGIHIDSYEELERLFLKTRHKLLGKFIIARGLYSNATTYGAGWLTNKKDGSSIIDGDGRIRCSWEQILNTGRMSTNGPNLLSLPKTGLQRSAIVPKPGHVFVIGDFSGQEIGVMAAASGEQLWIDAMLAGHDIHATTANTVNPAAWQNGALAKCTFPKKCGCPDHKRLREPAKQNNFMVAYGGGWEKLIMKIVEAMFEKGLPTEEQIESIITDFEARIYIKKFKRIYHRLASYLESNGRAALRQGVSFSADPFQRKRLLQGEEDWQKINQGKNNPIQSAGANMLKLAGVNMPDKYPIVLFFHDEFVCEVKVGAAKQCATTMKKVMEEAADFITGIPGLIKVEPRIAKNFLKK